MFLRNYFNGGIQLFAYVAIFFAIIECRVKYVRFATETEETKVLAEETKMPAKTKKSTKSKSSKAPKNVELKEEKD